MLTIVGIIVLAAAGFWIAGGIALRIGGIFLMVAGLIVLAAYGNASSLIIVAAGLVLWLLGQWHYGVKHHEFASPLARRIFYQVLPARLDPTRNWGVPVATSREPRGNDLHR